MKLITKNFYFTTSLFVKILISIILINLITLSLAAKTNEFSSSTLSHKTLKKSHSARTSSRTTSTSMASKSKSKAKSANFAVYPVCEKNGFFTDLGIKSRYFRGEDLQKGIDALKKLAKSNEIFKQLVDSIIEPLAKKIPADYIPSVIMGDFNTTTITENEVSKRATCSEFPLAKNDKRSMSAVGFSAKVPCGPSPVQVGVCLLLDKCGTLAVTVSGATLACLTTLATAGEGAALSPLFDSMSHMQAGYSEKGTWETSMKLMDIRSKAEVEIMKQRNEAYLATKNYTLRSHIYMGTKFTVPKTGIKIKEKDITEIISLEIEGKAFIDLGEKNPLAISRIKETIENKKLTPGQKFANFALAAREYSISATGKFELKLADFTKELIPNFKIFDDLEYNVLMNLGSRQGNIGSSGTNPGFHLYYQPPVLNSEGINEAIIWVERQLNTINSILKIAKSNIVLPKIPSIKGTELGFFIGKDIRFKIDIKNANSEKSYFSMLCIVSVNKEQKRFEHLCEWGANYISIIKQSGMVFIKKGIKFLKDLKTDVINSFKNPLFTRDFPVLIQKQGVEFLKKAKESAKNLLNKAKELLANIQKKAEAVLAKLEKAKESVTNFINKVENKIKNSFKKLDNFLSNLFKGFGSEFNPENKNKITEKMSKALSAKAHETAKQAIDDWIKNNPKEISAEDEKNFTDIENLRIQAEVEQMNFSASEELQKNEISKKEQEHNEAEKYLQELVELQKQREALKKQADSILKKRSLKKRSIKKKRN